MSALGEPGARICRTTTSVKVQTFMGTGAVPCTETREKFPVLVRVTAAAAEEQISGGAGGVDIVAVLDVGGSIAGDKLKRVKDAMSILINKLGPEDRLSIVTFGGGYVRREIELTGMSDHQGRKAAKDVVKRLRRTEGDGVNTGAPPALHEGDQILRERQDDKKSSSRVGCIVFLSDGLDTQILDDASISSDFPVHTLGLGADHDPKALKHIAGKTSGTYSFANDLSKIKDACALFTSIPATSVEITLRAHEGALISSSEKRSSDDDGRSVAIRIGNMYAGEKKNFIIYLALEATDQEGRQKLLTIGGRYQNLSESKDLADTDVSVMRPYESCQVIHPVPFLEAVLTQIKMLFMGISGSMPPQLTAATLTTQGITTFKLQQILETIKEASYQNLTRCVNSFDRYKVWSGPLPYKLSWPNGGVVLTPPQEAEEIVLDANAAADSTTTTWGKFRAWARRHPCPRFRPGVAVVLLLTSLLVMMLYSGLQGSSMAKGMRAPLQYPMLFFSSNSNYAAYWDANKAKEDPKQVSAQEGVAFQLSGGKKTDKPAWKATDLESSSPAQLCCRDHGDDASVAKISDKCAECHGRGHDTYRESDLVAKILDIILSSVKGKENELKSLLVEARYDHE